MNIDCRWASPGIAKLWVSIPKQGITMATVSRGITRIIGEHKMQGIMIKRINSKNCYTTPCEMYGPHQVIRHSDPGHREKKCGITMYNKKFLLPPHDCANDESTLKMGVRQPSKPSESCTENSKCLRGQHHLIAMVLGPTGSMLES